MTAARLCGSTSGCDKSNKSNVLKKAVVSSESSLSIDVISDSMLRFSAYRAAEKQVCIVPIRRRIPFRSLARSSLTLSTISLGLRQCGRPQSSPRVRKLHAFNPQQYASHPVADRQSSAFRNWEALDACSTSSGRPPRRQYFRHNGLLCVRGSDLWAYLASLYRSAIMCSSCSRRSSS